MFTAAEMNRIANSYYEGTCIPYKLEIIGTEIFAEACNCKKYLNFDYVDAFFDDEMDAYECNEAMDDMRAVVQILRNHGFDVKWNYDCIIIRW